MIGWMAYSVVVAALLGLAALVLERFVGAYGRPTRWLWAGALGGSVVVPALVRLGFGGAGESVGAVAGWVIPLAPLSAVVEGSASVPWPDRPLALLWLITTLAAVAYVAASLRSIRRRRREWRSAEVEGSRVLVSRSTGPAVVGLVRSAVVLPEWALELDRAARALLLEHEREHARCGDPALLLAGLCAVVAMPWNPALWWQLRRLRLAVEVDCDARVLRGGVDPRRYGALLLEVGRRAVAPVPAGVAFSVRRSQLERRIRALVAPAPRHRALRAAAAVVVAGVVLAAACAMPLPTDADAGEAEETAVATTAAAEPAGRLAVRTADAPTFTPYTIAPELKNGGEVQRALERFYPPLLRDAGIGGRVVVWFFIDENGRVQDTRVRQSSGHDSMDRAALKVADMMEFSPALNRDQRVKVWVSMPISFSTR